MKLVIWVELYLSGFHAEASVPITQLVAVLANRSAKRWLGLKVATSEYRRLQRQEAASHKQERSLIINKVTCHTFYGLQR